MRLHFSKDFIYCLLSILGDLLTLGLKLDGTDLDDLKNATIVDVAPLRQSTIPEGIITRLKFKLYRLLLSLAVCGKNY